MQLRTLPDLSGSPARLHVWRAAAQCFDPSLRVRMYSSYSNPSVPLPAERLRVGECEVDIPLREVVRADGSKTRITVKSMAVLLVLVEHAGQVVSRDALLESVWAGTMPTDDVVTQAVTGLRKALGDDRDAPRYVETIPKSGYRLLADVEWRRNEADGGAAMQAAITSAARPSARWLRHAAWLPVVAAVIALVWWGARDATAPQATWPSEREIAGDVPYTLLTSRLGPELQPALSPDGALVAFAMPPESADGAPAIFVQAVQSASPRQLTTPPPGHSDHLPRWSPDARQSMFARIDATGGCALHLMPSSGGATRVVGACDRINGRYDWLPDGSGIIAGLKADGARPAPLSVLHLEGGQWQAMRYPIGTADVDFDPRFSPDGTQLAFRRNLSHSDLWLMPAAGGEPRQLTRLRGSISGWDWGPDGRTLLLGLLGNPPQLYRHHIESGSTQALGRFPATGLDIAARRGVMAFAIDDARIAMFRYRLPLRVGVTPEALFASTGNDLLPSPSPDGHWLAFYSDRSREARLWLADPGDAGHLRMVEGITPIWRQPPQWSADSTRLLVIGEGAGNGGKRVSTLYEVDAASGRAKPLMVQGAPYFAQYLPERRLLLVVNQGAGHLSLQILDAQSSPMRVLAQRDDVGEARFDAASGQVHFVRATGPGLWRVGLDLRAPVSIDTTQPAAYWLRRWAVLDGKAFALRTAAPDCLANWYWLGREAAPDPGCLDREQRGVPALAPVVSADGQWLYMSMVAGQENSDIGLLELDALDRSGDVTH